MKIYTLDDIFVCVDGDNNIYTIDSLRQFYNELCKDSTTGYENTDDGFHWFMHDALGKNGSLMYVKDYLKRYAQDVKDTEYDISYTAKFYDFVSKVERVGANYTELNEYINEIIR